MAKSLCQLSALDTPISNAQRQLTSAIDPLKAIEMCKYRQITLIFCYMLSAVEKIGWRLAKMFRASGILKLAALIFAFLLVVFLAFQILEINVDFKLPSVISRSVPSNTIPTNSIKYKCGLSKACPAGHFAFKMASGAASVVGPRICLEDKLLMSGVKNNVGRGINIALVNGKTGDVVKTEYFDMWAGDVAPFITFLKGIEDGTIVMMASFDDSATKLNDEARKLIADLGSSTINNLGFRDNWIFVGGKGIRTKTPFEQHIKNSAETNKFEGWPEVLEMEGCIPQRQD